MKNSEMTKLFLTWACPECERIKRELTEQSIYQDDYFGRDHYKFVVIYTFSNTGARDVLDQYGLIDAFMPVLQLPDGNYITETDQIIKYLNEKILIWRKRI